MVLHIRGEPRLTSGYKQTGLPSGGNSPADGSWTPSTAPALLGVQPAASTVTPGDPIPSDKSLHTGMHMHPTPLAQRL